MLTRLNKTTRMPLFLGAVSLYAAIAVFVYFGYPTDTAIKSHDENVSVLPNETNQKNKVNYGTIVSKTIIDGEPQTFIMDRLGIVLQIKYGYFDSDSNSWTVSDDAIYYAYGTALPNNQRGNTFLYGHNRDSVVAKLSDLVADDEVKIITINGHTFIYSYVSDDSVSPDYVDILKYDPNTPRLTVMTCEGVWSLTRRLMYFDLKESI